MNLSISVPEEVEAAVRRRAAQRGQDVDSYLREVIVDEVAEELATPRRKMSHEEFLAKIQEIIDLHPTTTHFVDDSRESIYAGRGE